MKHISGLLAVLLLLGVAALVIAMGGDKQALFNGSLIIDPFGRIQAQSAMFTPAVLEAVVVPLQVGTVYKRFGDWVAWACVVVSVGAVVAGWRR